MSSSRNLAVIGSFALGAAVMYFLASQKRDPIGRTQQRVVPDEQVDDTVLVARVRAAMGHIAPSLATVIVRAENGCVILEGTAAPADAEELAACARHVRGVSDVDNRLRDAA